MEIKELCDKIIELYELPDTDSQDRVLILRLVQDIRMKISLEDFSIPIAVEKKLIPILELTKKIALTKRNLKQILEKELLMLISYLPYKLWRETDENNDQIFERDSKNKDGQIAESLINFCKSIYEIKVDRDAFAGKRRGYAVQILESLSNYFEVPEFMELCSKSIRSKSKNEFLDAIECLKEYCKARNIIPSEDLISVIDKRIKKTKHRSEATGGLILQVETGLISELEALSRLDEWKEKNDYW